MHTRVERPIKVSLRLVDIQGQDLKGNRVVVIVAVMVSAAVVMAVQGEVVLVTILPENPVTVPQAMCQVVKLEQVVDLEATTLLVMEELEVLALQIILLMLLEATLIQVPANQANNLLSHSMHQSLPAQAHQANIQIPVQPEVSLLMIAHRHLLVQYLHTVLEALGALEVLLG